MRICIFGPDMTAFEQHRLRQLVLAPPSDGWDEVLLTNSRGQPPRDGTHVHVTGGAATLRMRGLRWLLSRVPAGATRRAAARVGSWLCGDQLVEGLRAADPDAVIALDPAWAHQLRDCIGRRGLPWPCLEPGTPLPPETPRWRRYDPELLVTIVLPTYNGTKYLAESLASCLGQTHRRCELIVVDDGSGPEVHDLVAGCNDPRVRYVRHPVNRGLPAALNTGFAAAAGSLLTWTSDDNLYAPDAIEQMVTLLCTHLDVDFVYADAHEIDAAGKVVGPLRVEPPDWLRVKNRVGGCFLYRRSVYLAIGEYDPDAVLAEDYDYWLRVATRFTMQRLFRTLYYYRYHPKSLTSSSARDDVKRQAQRVKEANKRRWRRTRLGSAT